MICEGRQLCRYQAVWLHDLQLQDVQLQDVQLKDFQLQDIQLQDVQLKRPSATKSFVYRDLKQQVKVKKTMSREDNGLPSSNKDDLQKTTHVGIKTQMEMTSIIRVRPSLPLHLIFKNCQGVFFIERKIKYCEREVGEKV